jgi:hypothetical protein
MNLLISFLSILLVLQTASAPVQPPSESETCQFNLSGSPVKPTFEGPQEVTDRVYFVDQPDSPLEIVSVDFTRSFLSVARERMAEQLRCTAKVRNHSDQTILGFDVHVIVGRQGRGVGTTFGGPPTRHQTLAPGQEWELQGCGAYGVGGAPENGVYVFVFVNAVDIAGCTYQPSMRYPHYLQ